MDWNYAIERNRDALKRVLAALVAMAGLVEVSALTSPLWGGRRDASGGGENLPTTPTRPSDDGRPPHKGEVGSEFRPTLPRHLHRAVLRLLRPAEAAARRLVIMAARGVTLPPPRRQKPKPPPESLSKGGRPGPMGGVATGIWMPPQLQPDATSSAPRRVPATATLPLFDPLPRSRGAKRRPSGVPRLCLPGWSAPHAIPPARLSKNRPPLGPDDTLDAARLALRLAALGRALDDLEGHAKRFARWQARRAGAGAKAPQSAGRRGRVWPLRPGRPPGSSARSGHAVHEILRDAHSLAAQALENPDTS
ncbi:MAG TPA: hypothetical protein VGN97_18490 [Mesorhizobium sp.]|jgi:hypothetical protein|nr:hypothetical protein [Mesorhizobium sp.]